METINHENYVSVVIINHKAYVSFELAKLLREAGFDWETRATYRYDNAIGKAYILTHYVTSENWNGVKEDNIDYVSAPTLEVAQRWLRDVKNTHIEVSLDSTMSAYAYNILLQGDKFWLRSPIFYTTYEKALESSIQICLTILLKEK